MAKKKKPVAKGAGARRMSRRGKQEPEAGESSAVLIQTPTEAPTLLAPEPLTLQPTDTDTPATSEVLGNTHQVAKSSAQATIPIVVLHKKFGKYRCLFNNEDSSKKQDMGSDSETSSSLDIRVVDPSAASESDSNTALDTQLDIASGAGPFSPFNNSTTNMSQSTSRDVSPSNRLKETLSFPLLYDNIEVACKNDNENRQVNEIKSLDTKVTEIKPLVKQLNDIEKQLHIMEEDTAPMPLVEENKPEETSHMPLISEQVEQMLEDNDDEVITVVQIVEDDNPEYYYDIQISSPKDEVNNEIVDTAGEPHKESISQFQQHFQKLNLSNSINVKVNLPMDCSDPIEVNRMSACLTSDLAFSKESLSDVLVRPDPSLTPSSTLSDDSNSSRVTSEPAQNTSNDSAESSPTGVRRSSRIKTISTLKQKTKGYGLVKTPLKKALMSQTKLKLEELSSDSQEKLPEALLANSSNSPTFPVPSDLPVKVKSRWRRSSELEMCGGSPAISPLASPSLPGRLPSLNEKDLSEEELAMTKENYDKIIDERMKQYVHLDENEYLCERMISRETKKMICDCFLTKEEMERGELGCGEDCLNRLLMIECNYRCSVGDRCTNRRFQKRELAPLKVFYADKKGCGVEASEDISSGEFLMEYVGEVLDYEQFYKRAQEYSDENNLHHYFMSLKGDTVIDATMKGNISRFINHSCDPNAETQKWTVNGELRIGFFSKRDIVAGEELTFDYQFQRFGKEAQRCYCGANTCRGWIGAEPDSDEEDEQEEEDDVTTSKSQESSETPDSPKTREAPKAAQRVPRKERLKYKPKASDLVLDADIEEDIESLSRSGIKNQSHTLRLSRTVVRAKGLRAQVSLLRLLRDADLPCRRLFLDYRGLRLLAPWCNDAPLDFKLEMLQTVDRLPVPNKTMVQESRFFTIVERWLTSTAETPAEPVFIDEATGLPIEVSNRTSQEAADKPKDNAAIVDKVKELSKQLLERWSSLKEVFKIPKKERIQQMKEHERQANVERRAADSSQSRDRTKDERREETRSRHEDARARERERDRERERERDRERERERERRERDRDRERERDERDRRKRRSSPEGRRSIRLSERVLASIPPMSKEERRRAFAEAAAAAEESRQEPWPLSSWPADHYPQMFQPGMMGGPPNMMGGPPNMMGGPPNMMGGPPNMMGGPPNMMSGPPNMVGGPPNMMGGPPNMVGGPPNIMGGPPNIMSGPPNMMGGPPNMMSGPPNMMGGPPNMMPNMPPGIMPGMPGVMVPEMPEWHGEYPGYCPPYGPQAFCMPQHNFMGMGGFGMPMMFGQTQMPFPPKPEAQSQPLPPQQLPSPQPPAAPSTEEVILPSLWRSAEDSRGRTYYYHVKQRRPQWAPPPPPSSNDAEETSSEEEEEEPTVDSPVMRRQGKVVEGVNGIYEVIKERHPDGLIPDHALLTVKPRKRRAGLVSEIPISPRTEEDKLAGRQEVKRYKETKEKLRRRREKLIQKMRLLQQATKKQKREITAQMVELVDLDSESDASEELAEEQPEPVAEPVVQEEVDSDEAVRKIKEDFRNDMAKVMVHHLNPFRHRKAPLGRITNTADFKHLARKLTHFVMLKELKHCRSIDELVVTESVNKKAKEFVRKYMAKFGAVYNRPVEEADEKETRSKKRKSTSMSHCQVLLPWLLATART